MISLWILAILVVFAIGLGHRASINLKLARYQRDRLKAYYLAKAGICKAIVELEKDQNGYDTLGETWSTGRDLTGKTLFENVEIEAGSGETFTVKYLYDKDKKIYLCMADEERKININSASPELLVTLLEECNLEETQAQEIANLIRVWRGDEDPLLNTDADAYKDFKKSPFSHPEELILVLEYFYQSKGDKDYGNSAKEIYPGIKDLIAAYYLGGNEKVNINTASREVLEILINTCFEKLKTRGVGVENPEGLLTSIMAFRDSENGFFTDLNLDSKLTGLTELQKNIINDSTDGLKNIICIQSNYFRIIADGKISLSKAASYINCVFNRNMKKIVWWHEN